MCKPQKVNGAAPSHELPQHVDHDHVHTTPPKSRKRKKPWRLESRLINAHELSGWWLRWFGNGEWKIERRYRREQDAEKAKAAISRPRGKARLECRVVCD